AFDAVNERLGGHGADLTHRLADSYEAGQMKGRFANVVETDHRDVLGHAQSGFPDSAYSANRRNVVVSEKRGEGNLARQQHFGGFVSLLRRGIIAVQLGHQFGPHFDPQLASRGADSIPPGFRVNTQRLSLDDRDRAM